MKLNEHYLLNENTDGTYTCIQKENNARITFSSKRSPKKNISIFF